MDEFNQWQEDLEVVRGIVVNYYQNLFTSTHNSIQEELLEARVLELMNTDQGIPSRRSKDSC